MMFSHSFALFILIVLGVNGQTNDINALSPKNLENGYPFGKLRLSNEGNREELIPSSDLGQVQLNEDQSSDVQPLPSPCVGARTFTKLAHPIDKTKFIQCRDEFHYEVFTCPNGGEFNQQTNSCDVGIPVIDKCEQEKPCFNGGQCTLLSNSSYKCNCLQDWTGDRCETPLNSCVTKPCGPNAECRHLKASDYGQDYVCVCDERSTYGLNCQETKPNPCLTNSEQFFPFAFSQHAYIQCDGEHIFFQPCAKSLYWNQEGKLCDRKRSTKVKLSKSKNRNDNQIGQTKTNIDEEIITTTTTIETEQQNSFVPTINNGNDGNVAFVPARVANRQQLQSNMNNQQVIQSQRGQQTQQLPSQLMDSNQYHQDFNNQGQQWSNQQIDANVKQPLTIQSGRNQQWSQNIQQQSPPTSMDTLSMDFNIGQSQRGVQSQIRQDNQQQQQQQQNFPQHNQAFGTQQWLNQVPDVNKQNYIAQPQSWQGSQTIQNHPQLHAEDQHIFIETTTAAQNLVRLQGFVNPSSQNQEQSWRNIQHPQSVIFKTQNTQLYAPQSQPWQNQQQLTANIPESISSDNNIRFDTGIQQDNQLGFEQQNIQNQQSWQNTRNNQVSQPGGSSIEVQRFRSDNQQPFIGQSAQNQHWATVSNAESFADLNNAQLQRGVQSQIGQVNQQQQQQQNIPQQNQAFGTQQWLNQVPDVNKQNYIAQPQSWQGSQTILNQSRLQNDNQQTFIAATPAAQNVVRLQGSVNLNSQNQEQPWQNNQNIQQIQNQPVNPQLNQIFAFKPQQWTDTSKQNKQDNILTSQSVLQNRNQQAFIPEASPQIQNNQFGLNKQQNVQTPSWQNNQQLQTQQGQLTDSDDFKIQTSQNFVARPTSQSFQTQQWSPNGQLSANSFETATIANKDIHQGLTMQGLQGWQPTRMVERRQQDNNQIDQQTTTEQRKSLGSIPTLLSGSWKSRS